MSYDQRRSRADVSETSQEYDEPWPARLPSTVRRYDLPMSGQSRTSYRWHPDQVQRTPIPARRSALPTGGRQTEETAAPPRHSRNRGLFRAHPLLWTGLGMLLMFLLWVGLQDLGNWWSLHQDDVTYGRPRTAQYDVVMGHHDSSAHPTHLIALNLNATVIIIELPGGDINKAHIYQGPQLFGPGADLFPVTLSFPVPAGQSLPNMEVHVQGQVILYLNQNGQFVPQGSSH